jgi:hypothetical protein
LSWHCRKKTSLDPRGAFQNDVKLSEIIMEINDLQKMLLDNQRVAQNTLEINDLRGSGLGFNTLLPSALFDFSGFTHFRTIFIFRRR